MTHTTLIQPAALAEHLDSSTGKPWLLLDARFSLAEPAQGYRAFARSRIPGARHVHLENDLSAPVVAGVTGRHPLPERAALVATLTDLGADDQTQIVAYDDSGGAFAARLWWLTRWLGHESVAVLDGGFNAWQNAGLPLEETPPATDPIRTHNAGSFTDRPSLTEAIDIDAAASGRWLLVDAREAARFRGEIEPIDPVAGHIAGAVNRPFVENLDTSGRFLPIAQLRERFARLEREAGDRPLAHYCGSGVTAAHNMLAMTHAGLDAGVLYAGSFSEWITRSGDEYPVAPQVD